VGRLDANRAVEGIRDALIGGVGRRNDGSVRQTARTRLPRGYTSSVYRGNRVGIFLQRCSNNLAGSGFLNEGDDSDVRRLDAWL
jgi:hypothetical protein